VGRFLSNDPAEGSRLRPESHELSRFVTNRPYDLRDPAGRESLGGLMTVVSIVGSVVATSVFILFAGASADSCDDSEGIAETVVGALPFERVLGQLVRRVCPARTPLRGANPAIARLPVPPTPRGLSISDFGRLMEWGSGHADAIRRISFLTREWLESVGVTYEIARAWELFYANEARRVATNPSALGRMYLMRAAVDLLR
jgi:hypothetical protein